ncbi:hypothetical protein EWF20_14210 [Sulfolobus sp. S-194]|uniref:hypothetical protein n=1 Tax=Sulfolobus sp. S-194 TaxID=2512240 RepID=UPI001436F290|nr:hypothetical protein [Sulfolobus sp. S-194]QIW25181.1 hypothetical protein EWF20_14210 [Sulfolobus sp. S-194]
MKRIITLSLEDLSEAKDKVRRVLKKLQYEDEVIILSKSDISYLFRGYNVEKEKNEEGLWIIRIKKN